MNTIPSLLGTTLSGRGFRIPEDLPFTPVALVFEFGREARHDSAMWKRFFTEQGIDFFSLPTTPVYIPAAAMADTAQAMKSRVSPAAWKSIVLVHKGGSELLLRFGWNADGFAKVLLMASGALKVSHGDGPFTDEAAKVFSAAAF